MEAGIWIEKLRAAGAIAVGICEIGNVPEEHMESLRTWLSTGMNAGMGYMGNHEELRRDPRGLLEGARSIVSMAYPYAESKRPASLPQIASYAFGEDYHDLLRRRLTKAAEELESLYGGEYRICIDSAPVFERYWAERSGVGRRCDNGLIAVKGYGTRVLLAEIITTLEIEKAAFTQGEDSGIQNDNIMDICLHCGACRRACPAGALQMDSRVDARRCLSYLTIEHRGDWDAEGVEAMKTPAGRNTLFGCDICQNVCPLNRAPLKWIESEGVLAQGYNSEDSKISPELLSRLETITAAEVEAMTQADFSRLFKGSAIKRTKLTGLKRNAGNRE